MCDGHVCECSSKPLAINTARAKFNSPRQLPVFFIEHPTSQHGRPHICNLPTEAQLIRLDLSETGTRPLAGPVMPLRLRGLERDILQTREIKQLKETEWTLFSIFYFTLEKIANLPCLLIRIQVCYARGVACILSLTRHRAQANWKPTGYGWTSGRRYASFPSLEEISNHLQLLSYRPSSDILMPVNWPKQLPRTRMRAESLMPFWSVCWRSSRPVAAWIKLQPRP